MSTQVMLWHYGSAITYLYRTLLYYISAILHCILLHCSVGLYRIARVRLLDISLQPSAAVLLHILCDDYVGVRGVCRGSE